jgi:hypothetical protein
MDQLTTWVGDNPFFLVIKPDPAKSKEVVIDLDRPQWAQAYRRELRRPGLWLLVSKETRRAALIMEILEGEQPYYMKKHVGQAFGPTPGELSFFGIGKKRRDGHVDRLWITPIGAVCPGDDPEGLTPRLLALLFQAEQVQELSNVPSPPEAVATAG